MRPQAFEILFLGFTSLSLFPAFIKRYGKAKQHVGISSVMPSFLNHMSDFESACTCGLRCWIQVLHCGRLSNFSVQDDRWTCNTNGMNFNEGNNEQPCVPDAHGFSSLTVNSSQKRQEVEEMVFRERYFETRGPTSVLDWS